MCAFHTDSAKAETEHRREEERDYDIPGSVRWTTGKHKEGGGGEGGDGARKVLRPTLFEPKSVAEMQAEYRISEPYRHLVIPNLMDSEVLRTACEELKSNMQATLKETDIFKVSIVCCIVSFRADPSASRVVRRGKEVGLSSAPPGHLVTPKRERARQRQSRRRKVFAPQPRLSPTSQCLYCYPRRVSLCSLHNP